MSTAAALRAIGRPVDGPASLARALDDLLAARTEPPTLLALGEPAHGVRAFPLLRNELLAHLVERGYRSIALETDLFAASILNNHITAKPTDTARARARARARDADMAADANAGTGVDTDIDTDIDTVLATGFSHGFGTVPGNRELVDWLRTHNATRPPQDQVHCHGFDAPTEFASAPSPRHALSTALHYLPAALRPASARDLDALAGPDADWTNPAAMYDPAASIGASDRAQALRVLADDLTSALHRAAPALRSTNPTTNRTANAVTNATTNAVTDPMTGPAAYDQAVAHARTAQGLLRYHAAMASAGPDRIAALLSVRADMMADNLLAIRAQEHHRGPTLVFAHNAHLQRRPAHQQPGADEIGSGNAGALVELALGEDYLFVATDANSAPDPATLQGHLAQATTRRTLFPTEALRAALPTPLDADTPIVRGHIPLTPPDLDRADAIIFITDTDATQHQYW